MNFVKESVNQQPIVDTVFAIVDRAKKAKEQFGDEAVVDATIGSLYDESGSLVALDTVFSSLKSLDNGVLAKYAASFTGNPDFKKKVEEWVLDGNCSLEKEIIATPGGTGAVGMTVSECLEQGQTLIVPEIAWGSYNLMA
ncbi:MAG TPA: aspartate/aromatic aminotransferase, partial [Erysipelotrichaceae bacterium]|nr:aspartate/aromatic aminotransferase [Erysipelotrichaceae bacterium]